MSSTIPGTNEFYDEWIRPRITLILQMLNETLIESSITAEQRQEIMANLNEKMLLSSFFKGCLLILIWGLL